jgi:hypothetical protein
MFRRYSEKSKLKSIKLLKSLKKEVFKVEIIKNASQSVNPKDHKRLISDIHNLAVRGWGDFDKVYLEKSVIDSHYLALVCEPSGKLIGMAPIKKMKVLGRPIYSFGLSVVDPDYQTLGLLKKMSRILLKSVIVENLLRGKLKVEVIFITPNIRTMGAIARVASFIYPNPYLIDEFSKKIPRADNETWKMVKEFLTLSKEYFRRLDREGCIMEGFYDDRPHLIVRSWDHLDKPLNLFAENYLYITPGREVVVRAIIDIWSIIKNGY